MLSVGAATSAKRYQPLPFEYLYTLGIHDDDLSVTERQYISIKNRYNFLHEAKVPYIFFSTLIACWFLFSGNRLGDEGAKTLAEIMPKLQKLEKLDIEGFCQHRKCDDR